MIEGTSATSSTRLFPPGVRCELEPAAAGPDVLLGPGPVEWIACMAVAALLLALAPRSRALTGAAIAVVTLGVAGLLFLWSGNFQLATSLACLFGLGAAYELGGRVRDLLVVPAVLAVWAVPYLLGVPRAAEAAAIAAGAGAALLLASGRRGDRAGALRTPAGRRGSTRSP